MVLIFRLDVFNLPLLVQSAQSQDILQRVAIELANLGNVVKLPTDGFLHGSQCRHNGRSTTLQDTAVLIENGLEPLQMELDVRGSINLADDEIHEPLNVRAGNSLHHQLNGFRRNGLVHLLSQLNFIQLERHD